MEIKFRPSRFFFGFYAVIKRNSAGNLFIIVCTTEWNASYPQPQANAGYMVTFYKGEPCHVIALAR